MNTKLTLTIEQEIIDVAKEYAKEKGQSLSDMVENYFKLLTKENRVKGTDLSPTVSRLRGVLSLPKDSDYDQIIEEERLKKYNG